MVSTAYNACMTLIRMFRRLIIRIQKKRKGSYFEFELNRKIRIGFFCKKRLFLSFSFMDMTFSLLIPFIICLLLIIIISGVEYAYLASNKLTIELKRKQGTHAGNFLGGFFDQPEKFWSGTVIGFYILLVCFCFLFSKVTTWLLGYMPDFIGDFFATHFYFQMV